MYGMSRTEVGETTTIAHIVREGSDTSLCGVAVVMQFNSLDGWNICIRCQDIAKAAIMETWKAKRDRKFKLGDRVWVERGPYGTKKPGVVIMVRGGVYRYRVRYEQKAKHKPYNESWSSALGIEPREELSDREREAQ